MENLRNQGAATGNKPNNPQGNIRGPEEEDNLAWPENINKWIQYQS